MTQRNPDDRPTVRVESHSKTLQGKPADSHYRPSTAEMKREYDMPAMSDEEMRLAFFNPIAPGRTLSEME